MPGLTIGNKGSKSVTVAVAVGSIMEIIHKRF